MSSLHYNLRWHLSLPNFTCSLRQVPCIELDIHIACLSPCYFPAALVGFKVLVKYWHLDFNLFPVHRLAMCPNKPQKLDVLIKRLYAIGAPKAGPSASHWKTDSCQWVFDITVCYSNATIHVYRSYILPPFCFTNYRIYPACSFSWRASSSSPSTKMLRFSQRPGLQNGKDLHAK